ncbi:MAG: DNA translocase FtsK 4TM domain-containing protein [Gemmatimonadales bacterium]
MSATEMVSEEQRREIGGVALLAVALFLLLALVPTSALGSLGSAWFPSGNMMGPAGRLMRDGLGLTFGASMFLAPALFVVGGLKTGGWLAREHANRLVLLDVGLMVLLPTLLWIVVGTELAAGWLGEALGAPLLTMVGSLGAVLVTGLGLVVLSVGTLGWNPLRSVGRGVLAGSDAAGRTARALADTISEKGKELTVVLGERRSEAEDEEEALSAAPLPGLEPEWMDADEPAEPAEAIEPRPVAAAVAAVPVAAVPTLAPPLTEPTREDVEPAGTKDGSGEAKASDAEEQAEQMALFDHEMPPVDLLSAPEHVDRESMDRQLDELGKVLVEKLRTFNVESELGGRTTGPMVTQFEVVPAPGVKVNRIANLDADLALAMKAHAIRIVAPIPGKGAVGVEIPNPRPEIVNLREILETPAFRSAKGELPLALGKDLNGRPYVASLEAMPHVLIAGATGSGKSVCLNTIVTSLVYKHTPETLRLLMIDPKMVELSVYSRLPHLRHNVVTDPRDAAGVLKWAVLEMARRYALLKANYVRSIQEFNRKVRAGKPLKRVEPKGPEGDENRWIYTDGVLPYIVVVVDELADLMMTVQSEIEKPLTQLAQKARAIGIHLIVATQRPSVNVITGLIKANFPTRIAFRVASKTDSRTILDQNGADALLGNGDMLFLPPGRSDPVRIQGAYLPTEDTERLMTWYIELLERHGVAEEAPERTGLETDILDELRDLEAEVAEAEPEEIRGDWDELFRSAAEICIQNGGGSTSLLQRRLSIGYGRAARIVDQLQDAGVLGPSEGAKGREVLMGLDGLDAMLRGG